MGTRSLTITHLTHNHGVLFTTGCINHKFVFKFITFKLLWLKNSVWWTISILVIIWVWKLLHAVKAPTPETTLVCDCQAMPISRDNLDHLLRNGNFLWSSVPHLEERSYFLTILFTLATLSECIVTHSPNLTLSVKHDDMINPSSNHFQSWQVFHEDGLINK